MKYVGWWLDEERALLPSLTRCDLAGTLHFLRRSGSGIDTVLPGLP